MRCGNQHDATSPHACAALGAAWHTDSGRRNSCNVSLCRLCALPVSSCLSVSLSLCLSVSLFDCVLVCPLCLSISLSYVGLVFFLENFSYGARSLAWLRILSRFLSVFQQDTGVDLLFQRTSDAAQGAQHALVFSLSINSVKFQRRGVRQSWSTDVQGEPPTHSGRLHIPHTAVFARLRCVLS